MGYDVSVLIPCYRIDQWLSDALHSVETAAKGLKVECVIVANNLQEASVNSLEVLFVGVLNMDVKVVNAGKTDLAGALNFGLSKCSSEIIARMDADDLMMPHRLTMQLKFLKENQDVVLVGTFVETINSIGERLYLQKYPVSHEEIVKSLSIGNCFAHPAIMYRKNAIQQMGSYNSLFTHAEDYALYFSAIKKFRIANIPSVGTYYRINSRQVSVQSRLSQEISTRAIILHNALTVLELDQEFPLPASNAGLNAWLGSTRKYAIVKRLSLHRKSRNNAKHLRRSLAKSHIAIARFSGIPGRRVKFKVAQELTMAFLYAPIQTLRFIFVLLYKVSHT